MKVTPQLLRELAEHIERKEMTYENDLNTYLWELRRGQKSNGQRL
jgi:hypothetical protein